MIHLTTSRMVCRLHRKWWSHLTLSFAFLAFMTTLWCRLRTTHSAAPGSKAETRENDRFLEINYWQFFCLLLNFCDNKISTAIAIFLALCEFSCSGIRLQELDVHETITVLGQHVRKTMHVANQGPARTGGTSEICAKNLLLDIEALVWYMHTQNRRWRKVWIRVNKIVGKA